VRRDLASYRADIFALVVCAGRQHRAGCL